ncbi:hypothetical protein, partial [Alloscardovia theropitheci]
LYAVSSSDIDAEIMRQKASLQEACKELKVLVDANLTLASRVCDGFEKLRDSVNKTIDECINKDESLAREVANFTDSFHNTVTLPEVELGKAAGAAIGQQITKH